VASGRFGVTASYLAHCDELQIKMAQGANRLMLNWDVFLPQTDRVGTQHAARAQLNLVF
jgi:hypothetical protein